MVTDAAGKHRRSDAQLPSAPDGMPFSSAEYLPAPVDVADPVADANAVWGPGRGGTLVPQVGDRALATPNGYPAPADPDWPPDLGGTGSWPQWGGPPPQLHPDHPSAPIPRVRPPQTSERRPPGPAGPGRVPAGYPGPQARVNPFDGATPPPPQQRPGGPNPGNRTPRANPAAQADLPARGYDPGQGYNPAQGYDPAPYPAQGYNEPPRYGPGHGYDPGQGYDPDPGYGTAHGYDAGPGYGSAQGHAMAQGYNPEPAHRAQGHHPGARGGRRLYAVPDDATATGMQPRGGQMAPHAGEQDPWDQAAATRRAVQEAAELRRQAAEQAEAIRQAAEREAAELRSALMTMSAQLSQVAAYVTDYLGEHLLREDRPEHRVTTGAATELAPGEAAVGPASPATRPERSPAVTGPAPADPVLAQPGAGTAGRQAAAMRKAVIVITAAVSLALVGGGTQLALRGYQFFVFRSAGTGATDNNGLQENQGPGQPDALRAHVAAKPAPAKPAPHHHALTPKPHHPRHRNKP